MPIQQIPRYRLLLGRIRKATDTNHKHFPILDLAFEFSRELSLKMNQLQDEEEKLMNFIEICTREIQDLPADFLKSKIRFFVDTFLVEILYTDRISNNPRRKQRRIYAFNDCIVITAVKDTSRNVCKHVFRIEEIHSAESNQRNSDLVLDVGLPMVFIIAFQALPDRESFLRIIKR